jgi:hypothetical protein
VIIGAAAAEARICSQSKSSGRIRPADIDSNIDAEPIMALVTAPAKIGKSKR